MKKATSIILTLALVLSFGITALAASGDPTGTQTVTGEGDTQYIDLEIYSVVLPTSTNLNFQLDPQGLLGIEPGATVDAGSLQGGGIVSTSTPKAINNSSVPVALTIALTGTQEGDATRFVTSAADVEPEDGANVTSNNILLYAVPSSVNITDAADEYAASSRGYPVTDTANNLVFVLDAAEYTITNTAGVFSANVKAGTGSGTAIQLGGRVNTNANWLAYTGDDPAQEVGISAVFSYAKANETQIGTETIEGIPGMISPTTGHVDVVPAGPSTHITAIAGSTVDYAPGIVTTSGTITSPAGGLTVLLSGKPASVASMTDNGTTRTAGTHYDYDASTGVLTIKATGAVAAARTYIVTAGGSTYTITTNQTLAP